MTVRGLRGQLSVCRAERGRRAKVSVFRQTSGPLRGANQTRHTTSSGTQPHAKQQRSESGPTGDRAPPGPDSSMQESHARRIISSYVLNTIACSELAASERTDDCTAQYLSGRPHLTATLPRYGAGANRSLITNPCSLHSSLCARAHLIIFAHARIAQSPFLAWSEPLPQPQLRFRSHARHVHMLRSRASRIILRFTCRFTCRRHH